MKLYFKQKFFSLRQRSEIYDEEGNVVFSALGEFLSLGRKMHLYDGTGATCFVNTLSVLLVSAQPELLQQLSH